ncbi:MAG: hypothetical protein II253_07100, partial [Lachnospiraceae bacterium]|nr:hypothetical protein [Lachnospiraceae bacterium]
TVRVAEVDRMGRINLTMRPEDMTCEVEKLAQPAKREERRDDRRRDDRRGNDRRDRGERKERSEKKEDAE